MNTFIMRSHLDREKVEIMFLKERVWIEERMHKLQALVMTELDRRVCRFEKQWLKNETRRTKTEQSNKQTQTEGDIFKDYGREKERRIPVSQERIFERKSDFPLIKRNLETKSKNMDIGPRLTKQELREWEREMEEYIKMIQMKRKMGIDLKGVLETDKENLKEKSDRIQMEMPRNVLSDIEDQKGETKVMDEGIGWSAMEKDEVRFLRKEKVQTEVEREKRRNEQNIREDILEEGQREMEAERRRIENEQRKRERCLGESQELMEADMRKMDTDHRKREESLKERQSEMEADRMQMESEQKSRQDRLEKRQRDMEAERTKMESDLRKREEMLQESGPGN
ncbi:stress response protein NST1-like [Esox lucius]|uniref:stress response protein NST1-like n=1 Tax=Esox lucius TaxID=8010 RepID=UPI00147721F4|nr:stress response protein NST1-like [Esox lucius]